MLGFEHAVAIVSFGSKSSHRADSSLKAIGYEKPRFPSTQSLRPVAVTHKMSLQDDKVTFCTSDDPPVKITASRITLIANSTVFRDMFSLPDTSTKEEPIHLSETEEEFQLFLSAMDGDEEVRKRLDQVGEEEEYEARWIALTKLADKYDSLSVRRFVEVRIW